MRTMFDSVAAASIPPDCDMVAGSAFPHGTSAGYQRGCKCRACLDAWGAYCKIRAPLHRERKRVTERNWRLAHREQRRAQERARITSRLTELNTIKLRRSCADCGYRGEAVALQFDHVRGVKRFALAVSHKYPMAAVIEELEKCEVVCANCHMIRTHRRRGGVA